MTIAEIAELAGVTTRAVRHYHRVGVLPEPERRPNGYRQYDLADLARLLRVRALIEAGVPLRRIAAMADLDAPDTRRQLDEVVTELRRRRAALDARIARLEDLSTQAPVGDDAGRALAALTAATGAAAGDPLGVLLEREAEALAAIDGSGRAPQVVADLGGAYATLADDPAGLAALREFADALAALDDDATPGQISTAVDLLLQVVPEPLLAELPAVDVDDPETAAWLGVLAQTDAHRAVFREFLVRISGHRESS